MREKKTQYKSDGIDMQSPKQLNNEQQQKKMLESNWLGCFIVLLIFHRINQSIKLVYVRVNGDRRNKKNATCILLTRHQ